jgi:hypothetical protein
MRESLVDSRVSIAGHDTRAAAGKIRTRLGMDIRIEQRQELRLAPHLRAQQMQQPQMWAAAERYEEKFGIRFTSLTHFPKDLLDELHRPEGDLNEVPRHVIIASQTDPTILEHMRELEEIANERSVTQVQRDRYYEMLLAIYRKLPDRPDVICKRKDVLCVGIQREGRLLAEAMGWLPKRRQRGLRPHAKRVPFEEGLLVGLTDIEISTGYSHCVIVDGAIASGATIMALIERLGSVVPDFHVYSVHGTYQGLRGITRYGQKAGVRLGITVGHATVGINSHFYAVVGGDENRLVVGDLGDTISDPEGHLRVGRSRTRVG